eukprot:TCALIF_04866-PA protein Name:"Similar to SLC13A5 Solute carrier family 13 member 5 (Homo sapiens)" AED:0.14 eAED:0.14 QI:162/0.5/0.54/1/0.9/0.81/11/0/719
MTTRKLSNQEEEVWRRTFLDEINRQGSGHLLRARRKSEQTTPAVRKVSFDYYAHPTQRHNLVPPIDEGIDENAPSLGLEFVQFAREDGVEEKLIVLRPDLEATRNLPKVRRHNNNNNNNHHHHINNNPDDALESGLDEEIEEDRHTWPKLLTPNDKAEDVLPESRSNRDMHLETTRGIFTLLQFWRSFLVIMVPLAALPLVFTENEDTQQAFRCAYVMVIMAAFWVTEALPLAITSLIPVALLPILGIMTTDEVGKEYLKETNMMFISGIIVAIAVEHCHLHKRIALNVLYLMGTSPRRVMLGFMLPTCFLSMWMSNTATTAMMVPIVDAVVTELEKDPEDVEMTNTGGTGSLTGTGSNLILKGVVAEFPGHTPINFANWMFYAVPAMLLNLLGCWLWLQYWFMGLENPFKRSTKTEQEAGNERRNQNVRRVLKLKIQELGRVTFHEAAVFCLFFLLVLLWLFRDPKFITGWGNFVHIQKQRFVPLVGGNCSNSSNCTYTSETYEKEAIDDATAGMLIVLLLFILPAQPNFWPFNRQSKALRSAPSVGLLEWSAIHDRMPWALVLLLGGGFALAKATDVSGLSKWMGSQLEVLNFLDSRLIVLVICILTAIATEVTSNVATASILMPVLRDLAISLQINPLYLMIPATLTCSYAFMLPVATPPNAIVYSASGMKTSDMFKCGFFVNIICVVINYACLNTYGIPLFHLDEVPEWVVMQKR